MRKFSILLVVAALLLAVFPAFAQDEEPTIAELVVASTTAETPEFTVLLAAVSAADPAFLEALSSEGSWTVFAPTDAAFVALLEALGTTAEELLANTELLNQVLAYHVVPGEFDSVYYTDLLGSVEGGAIQGTLLNDSYLAFSASDMGLMVNASTVVAADVQASNGIVHVIDAVLVPTIGEEEEAMEGEATEEMEEPGNIAEIVVASAGAEAPEFATLLAAVQAADPSILEALSNGGPWTVFAPTDAAFAALLEALETTPEDLLANTELLNTVLAYHVVPGTLTSTAIVGAFEMMEEGSVINAGTLLPQALVVGLGENGVVINETINVVAVDVTAANGVIHVIDGVLVPAME